MATNTSKYNFKKPDESDFYSIQDQNGNWDKAEVALTDLDTPTFEDYTGATPIPSAETALAAMVSKGKISQFFSNVKAFCKGATTIGMLVNNCVTNNPNLPLSAAQGKVLMDLFTKLNSDLTIVETNLNNVSAQLDPLKSSYTADINTSIVGKVNIVLWDVNTLYTPFKTGNTVRGNGFCITYNSGAPYLCQVAMAVGDSNLFTRNSAPEGWSGWTTK
ncbi:MAG: hypothetical protein RR559_01825 [Bacteroides sp.]